MATHTPSVHRSSFDKSHLETDAGSTRAPTEKEAHHDRSCNKNLLEAEAECTRAPITQPVSPGDDSDFPDGGFRAWLIVAGVLVSNISTFGFVNAWGAFQSYYQQTLLQDTSASNIAWIGSIQYSLIFFPGLFTGRLFDLGWFRVPLFVASCILVAATFLTAQCTAYWQFVLCQGIAIGFASGIIFGPSLGILSHWFKKRRATALGITACGSSVGGTVFPIAFRNLVVQIGFPWTMRVIGFILVFTLGFTNLTLRTRLPPVHVSGGLFNLKAFRSAPYSVYTFSSFAAFLGLYTVLTYIDVSAALDGIAENFSFYLVSIANATSFLGRVGAGLLADRFGAINIMIPFTIVAALMTYVWPFVHGKAAYVVVALIYGFSSGAFVSLLLCPIIAMGELGDVGRRMGMTMSVLAFGALAGPPISGAINGATGGFGAVGVYAGTMVVISVISMAITRHLVLGRLLGKF